MGLEHLKGYEDNPRFIKEDQFDLLKESFLEKGDISGIVFNVRNQRLVGGHQRTRALMGGEIIIEERFEGATKDGTVARGYVLTGDSKFSYREVDWDEKTHRGACLAANKLGGRFDHDMLANIYEVSELVEAGFEEADILGIEEKKTDTDDDIPRFRITLEFNSEADLICAKDEMCDIITSYNPKIT